jgi:ubiquinol-cytochrome c reductase cytochrome b subunit
MASRFTRWFSDRFPFSQLFHLIMDEEIPGGSSYFYTLGSSILVVFLLLVISGVWQLFFYVPSTDYAYISVTYLRINIPYGWLIHGIHYWAAQAMIVLVGLHMLRVFVWGAFKKPRELTWLIGVTLIILTAGMVLSGSLLPYDETGYFAAQVSTSITGTVPLFGNWLEQLVLGGSSIGQFTLSRFFIMHVAIIPAIMMIFIGFHLIAFRQNGSIGPWNREKAKKIGTFWTRQVYKDTLIISLVILIIIALSAIFRAPITGPADPLDTTFVPKPEWNFLILYEVLKAFKGAYESIGTIGIPLVLVLFLAFVPFFDRNPERNPTNRKASIIAMILYSIGILILTIVGGMSNPETDKASIIPSKAQSPEQVSPAFIDGQKLFSANNCLACHAINGTGGKIGPDLSYESGKGRSKDWVIEQVTNPKAHNEKSLMPQYPNFSGDQLNSISEFLLSLNKGKTPPPQPVVSDTTSISSQPENTSEGQPQPVEITKKPPVNWMAATFVGDPGHGELLYRQFCESCHGANGMGKVPNPGSDSGYVPQLNPINSRLYDLDVNKFTVRIDSIIQAGSTPSGPFPVLVMQGFGNSSTLTQQQIAQLESYILSINGVDRAKIENPGMEPVQFMFLSAGLFVLTGIVLFVFWLKKK